MLPQQTLQIGRVSDTPSRRLTLATLYPMQQHFPAQSSQNLKKAFSRNIRVETIEKIVVGSALQKHGFMFHYEKGVNRDSDDGDGGA